MKIKKRKPDFILILAVLVGVGVIITMGAKAVAQSGADVAKVEVSAYLDGWSKINRTNK